MIRAAPTFIVTTGRRTAQARLSLAGHWGNLPFDCVDAAVAEARRLGGPGATIVRQTSRRL